MLEKLTISRKLQLGFGVLVTLLATVIWGAYFFFMLIVGNDGYYRAHNTRIELLSMDTALLDMETRALGFAFTGDESFVEPMPQRRAQVLKAHNGLKELTADNPRQQELVQHLVDQYQQQFLPHIEHEVALRREADAGRGSMEGVLAYVRSGKGRKLLETMQATEDVLRQDVMAQRQKLDDATAMQVASVTRMLVTGGVVGPVLAILLAWALARSIVRPLHEGVRLTGRLAVGDLTTAIEVRGRDETARMMEGMREMVQR
ncbi:CHASE3 domain-containing protein, partial [Archangium sp.]|uniref:CHASE3 domain-containing protein n=1 Tax=Archangium sp. TaxID=1872627 RepID=UPI002ED92228